MSDDDQSDLAVTEMLQLLGNETRMATVRALWQDFDFEAYVTGSREPTAFETLREQAAVEDSGNFNYHLGQLEDVLVDGREGGYVLTPLGYNVMRAIEEYATFEYGTVEEWVVEDPCPFCGGDLLAEYTREILGVRCRDCGGLASGGNLTFVQLPATGARQLDRPALLDAAALSLLGRVRSSLCGVCWECRAPMECSLDLCTDHDRGHDGVCDACSLRFRTKVVATCTHCGTSGSGPAVEYAIASPDVGAFFGAHGRGPTDVGPWSYRLAALGAVTETVVDVDPATVELAFPAGEATRRVTVAGAGDGIAIRTERNEGGTPTPAPQESC